MVIMLRDAHCGILLSIESSWAEMYESPFIKSDIVKDERFKV